MWSKRDGFMIMKDKEKVMKRITKQIELKIVMLLI